MKDEKYDLIANSQSTLNWCKNHGPLLLNAFVINKVRQSEIHRAGPLILEPPKSEVAMKI
jgi:hypothetical protein